ncbi:MAG: response regulator transcription factor [Sulfuricellaceae bacterium]
MATPLNIIVVEDHDELREVTVEALGNLGHVVRGVDCAEALDDELGAFRADILLLDLNLPGEDGISLARRIREALPEVGIIMVTARRQVRDKIEGYGSGADIYLTKPTSVEELDAAIQALSRRVRPAPALVTGHLRLNPATLQLSGPRSTIDVSDQECSLLIAFSKARDHRLENWQIIELSGKPFEEFSKSALEVQIVRLRKKIENAGAPPPTIKAIRGAGYQLCCPLMVSKESGPVRG